MIHFKVEEGKPNEGQDEQSGGRDPLKATQVRWKLHGERQLLQGQPAEKESHAQQRSMGSPTTYTILKTTSNPGNQSDQHIRISAEGLCFAKSGIRKCLLD